MLNDSELIFGELENVFSFLPFICGIIKGEMRCVNRSRRKTARDAAITHQCSKRRRVYHVQSFLGKISRFDRYAVTPIQSCCSSDRTESRAHLPRDERKAAQKVSVKNRPKYWHYESEQIACTKTNLKILDLQGRSSKNCNAERPRTR